MKAKELMTKVVYSIKGQKSLHEAAKLMWEHDCGWLPVLDQDGRLTATITDRDIAMAAYLNGDRLEDIPVDKAKSKSVVSCAQSDDIDSIEKTMQTFQLRRLPVVDKHSRVVGVISINDLSLAFHDGKKGVDALGVSETLAAICSHEHVYPQVAGTA